MQLENTYVPLKKEYNWKNVILEYSFLLEKFMYLFP